MPDLALTHLLAMSDRIGLFQHATLDAPNPDFGYCTDDNARALMLLMRMQVESPSDARLPALIGRYFRFIQAAFVPETGTFRNLMEYGGKWADEPGPGDAVGRSLWALGAVVNGAPNGPLRIAAREMFMRALPASVSNHLRPTANATLGICLFLAREESPEMRFNLRHLADRLIEGLDKWQEPSWLWPEPMMTYENARIPHAVIAAGKILEDAELVTKGLTMLEWLMTVQTGDRQFSPVGNDGWYSRGESPARFDQQPIEAEATIAACSAAYGVALDSAWLRRSQRSFDWFLGANTAGEPLGNLQTGGCCDGLGRDGVNQNQGAESTLAWLSSQLEMTMLSPHLSQLAPSESR